MAGPLKARRLRRAAVVPFVAIALVLILSFVVLAIDTGLIFTAVGQMQRTADASALAGATGLMDGGSVVTSSV